MCIFLKVKILIHKVFSNGHMSCSSLRCFYHCFPKLITVFRCGSQWHSHLAILFYFLLFAFQSLLTIAVLWGISRWMSDKYFLDYLYRYVHLPVSWSGSLCSRHVSFCFVYRTPMARSLILHCLLWNQYVFREWNSDLQFSKQWVIRDLLDSRKQVCIKS